MFSPLQQDISDMTLPELEQKVAELSKKYYATHNPDLQSQIATFIDIYKQEIQAKIAKQKIQQQDDSDLDNLININ